MPAPIPEMPPLHIVEHLEPFRVIFIVAVLDWYCWNKNAP